MTTEESVGIKAFVHECGLKFTGIMKHRFRDFQVHEVNLEGEVARLSTFEVPASKAPGVSKDAEPFDPIVLAEHMDKVVAEFAGVAGETNAQILRRFLEHFCQVDNGAKAEQAPAVLEPIASKETRTAVHQFFKCQPHLPPIATQTIKGAGDDASLQRIQLVVSSSSGKGQQDSRGGGGRGQKRKRHPGSQHDDWRDSWSGGSMKCVRFVLLKENMDTQAAVASMARMLHVSNSIFGFAGTKDKRGVTSQFMTAFKIEPSRLLSLNNKIWGIRIGNLEYVAKELRLGDLKGNEFTVLLRDVRPADERMVARACEDLSRQGFINYFGLQRFGSGLSPTHKVGAALLKGEFKEAVELILAGHEGERADITAARQLYLEKGDIQGALQALPRWMVAERALLEGLQKGGANNFRNALSCVPRTLRMMYLHAYQSYLWNMAASHRVATHGVESAVAGDLVLREGEEEQADVVDASKACDGAENDGDGSVADTGATGSAVSNAELEMLPVEDAEGLLGSSGRRLGRVHVVTEEEVTARLYSIEDVVLPLPGTRVTYPQHSTHAVYKQCAEQDGVSLDAAQHSSKDLSLAGLTGDYRRLLVRPPTFKWRMMQYSNPDDDALCTTDWERLETEARSRDDKEDNVNGKRRNVAPTMDQGATNIHRQVDGESTQQKLRDNSSATISTVEQMEDGGLQNRPQSSSVAIMVTPEARAQLNELSPKEEVACTHEALVENGQEQSAITLEDAKGSLLALELSFQLPPSCYATMLIRELTKASTSRAFHANLGLGQ